METAKEHTPYIPPQTTSATIVATPSPLLWSQTYHAGKLFAVLALSQSEEDEDQTLSSIGKIMLQTLEEEYFTLEEKNLDTVKKAIELTLKKAPDSVTVCLVALSISGETAHLFLQGDGAILLRRDKKLGKLLDNSPELTSSTGVLEDGDIIALATTAFTNIVPPSELFAPELKTAADMVEAVTPKIHGKEDGTASSLLLHFSNPNKKDAVVPVATPETAVSDEEKEDEVPVEEPEIIPSVERRMPRLPHMTMPSLPGKHHVFLGVFVLILIVLVGSIFFVMKQREDAKMHALFTKTYDTAKKQYDEAQALMDLNKAIARTDLEKAKKTLEDKKAEFPKGSDEAKQVDELLAAINEALEKTGGKQAITPTATDAASSKLLSARIKDKDVRYTAQNEDTVFTASSDTITSIDKESDEADAIIENNDDWKTINGLGSFGSNLYVLDSGDGAILKFVPSGSEYTASNYLVDETDAALKKGMAIAIDSSIYALLSDGSVKKYTRGKEETFTLSGLSSPLRNPTNIQTNEEMDNIYILDNGNSRIVIVDKKGAYAGELSAMILNTATDFDVSESAKRIYVLQKGKVWELPIP